MILNLNGKKFIPKGNNSDDAIGFYKINKKSISLYDLNNNKIGVIVNGVIATASKLDNNKWWYSYAMPKLIGKYASIADYTREAQAAMSLLRF